MYFYAKIRRQVSASFIFYGMSYREGFSSYITHEKRLSGHTHVSYLTDLDGYLAFLKSEYDIENPSESNRQIIRAWLMHLIEHKYAASSVNRKISAIKSFYRYMRREGAVSENLFIGLSGLKTPRRVAHFLQPQQITDLIEFDESIDKVANYKDYLLVVIIELFYGTGIRRSELVGLKSGDYDVSSKQIKVAGKGNKQRLVPVSEKLMNVMHEYIKVKEEMVGHHSGDELLLTHTGKKLYPEYVYRLVRNGLSRVSTADYRGPHLLRHTFATHLLNKGANLMAIKELLGHSSLASTQVYTHTSFENLRKVFKDTHSRA